MIRKLAVVSACVLLAACANRAAVPDHVALPAAGVPKLIEKLRDAIDVHCQL